MRSERHNSAHGDLMATIAAWKTSRHAHRIRARRELRPHMVDFSTCAGSPCTAIAPGLLVYAVTVNDVVERTRIIEALMGWFGDHRRERGCAQTLRD